MRYSSHSNLSYSVSFLRRVCGRLGPAILSLVFGLVGGCGGGSKVSDLGGSLKVVAPDRGVQLGATEQLRAQLVLSDGTVKDVSGSVLWTSSDPSVATVNSTGLVTPVGSGKTTIQASLSAAAVSSASADVIVTKLFGVTECCPNSFIILTPSAGSALPPLPVGDITTGFTAASATDPIHHRFYVFPIQNGNSSMVAIDTQSATVLSTQQLTVGLFATQWDQQTGNILAITDCCPNQLVSIDVTTGTATPIAAVGDATVGFNGASAMDQVNHRFYFIRFDSNQIASLVGIDPSTGVVTAQFTLSGPAPILMASNAATGNLVGIARIANPPTNPFLSIETTTGVETTLAPDLFDQDLQGWTMVSASDSVRNRFYAIRIDLGNGGPATLASLNRPAGVVADQLGSLYIADSSNNRVRKVDTSGVITTVVGNGTAGYGGDGGAATSANLSLPSGVAFDSAGNLYVADSNNNRVRKVDTTGVITTVAGNGTAGYGGDGGAATLASLNRPAGVAAGQLGSLYIADSDNNRVRKVDTNGVITTVAGNGTGGYGGDGGAATSANLSLPSGVAFDSAGNLYVADSGNNRVREVDTNGVITTVAGNGTGGYGGDGGAATSANLSLPSGVVFDSAGNLYVADSDNNRVRKVDTNGVITTVAGRNGDANQLVGIDTTGGTISETLRLQSGLILMGSE